MNTEQGVLNVFNDGSFMFTREGTDTAIAATAEGYVCSISLAVILEARRDAEAQQIEGGK